MLYIGLRDYEHFKELFSKRETSNGTMVRQNRILLSYYKNAIKNHEVFTEAKKVVNMTTLYKNVFWRIQNPNERKNMQRFYLSGFGDWFSNQIITDELDGLCKDGDASAIRYKNLENGRIFKMKAGKFFKRIILETEYGRKMDEPTLLYVLECLSREWNSMAMERIGDYELVVDDDFESIYNGDLLGGDFKSCMTDGGYHYFYSNAVNASAASIRKDEMIYARCVIFNKVKDVKTGEVFRLAERQYSSEGDEVLKHILVNKLIDGGYIDGYKKVGAGCHNSRAFVSNKGEDLSEREFVINCNLDFKDELSYQDSFKWYDKDNYKAYNYEDLNYTHKLDITDGQIEGEWDEYHERYCESTTTVYVRRYSAYRECYYWQDMQCDNDSLDDFAWVDRWSEYYERDHCYYSECKDEYIPEGSQIHCVEEDDYQWDDYVVFCEETGSYFTCEDAMNEWLKENREEEEEEEEEKIEEVA